MLPARGPVFEQINRNKGFKRSSQIFDLSFVEILGSLGTDAPVAVKRSVDDVRVIPKMYLP